MRKGILAADQAACGQVVRVFHAPIFSVLYQLCRDVTLLKISRKRRSRRHGRTSVHTRASSIRTWLHRIAYRKFVDLYRRRTITATVTLNEIAEPAVLNEPSPAEAAVIGEQACAVRQALNMLAAPERELLILRYFQDLSFQEVSEVLDEPVGTLKWRASQALAKLRNSLANCKRMKPNRNDKDLQITKPSWISYGVFVRPMFPKGLKIGLLPEFRARSPAKTGLPRGRALASFLP